MLSRPANGTSIPHVSARHLLRFLDALLLSQDALHAAVQMLWDQDPKVQAQALRDLRWCGREFPVDAAAMLGEMLDAGEPSKQDPGSHNNRLCIHCPVPRTRMSRRGYHGRFGLIPEQSLRSHPSISLAITQGKMLRAGLRRCDGCLQLDARNPNILTLSTHLGREDGAQEDDGGERPRSRRRRGLGIDRRPRGEGRVRDCHPRARQADRAPRLIYAMLPMTRSKSRLESQKDGLF